jgi:hypothetical protein
MYCHNCKFRQFSVFQHFHEVMPRHQPLHLLGVGAEITAGDQRQQGIQEGERLEAITLGRFYE